MTKLESFIDAGPALEGWICNAVIILSVLREMTIGQLSHSYLKIWNMNHD